MFEDAVPFGIHLKTPVLVKQKGDEDPGREAKILINPPGDHLMDAEDEIIVIAEDDDSFQIGELNMVLILRKTWMLSPYSVQPHHDIM